MEHVFKLLGYAAVVASVGAVAFAIAPTVLLAALANAVIVASLAIVGPGVLSSLSLAIPSRARAIGFSIGALFVIPGLLVLPVVGWVGDNWGLRWGLALMAPVFLIGGLVISSVGRIVGTDIADVWTGAATRAELLLARQRGELTLLLVRKLDVRYGDVQVLFGVDFEVDEGEIVALLGTNGAGKSTLLKAISGIVEASNGAVVFDGRRHHPRRRPSEIAALGIAQVPGGQGVFPTLTVAENLRAACWLLRRGPEEPRRARPTRCSSCFPVLARPARRPGRQPLRRPAADARARMAFLARPRLLVIDELSLGLAPVVVEQLLEHRAGHPRPGHHGHPGRAVGQRGAHHGRDAPYFMEKGEIRFHGPTAELLDRPDLLRSVFLEGATDLGDGDGPAGEPRRRRRGPCAASPSRSAAGAGRRPTRAGAGADGRRSSPCASAASRPSTT